MDDQLCILTVHAHPDDEASKGAGTIAKYHAAGVHTVLVTCTGGEEGDILNPVMDTARGARRHRRCPPRRARAGRRDHRLRRARPARLPRLGHGRARRPTPTRAPLPPSRSRRPSSASWPRSAGYVPRWSSPTATTTSTTPIPTTSGCTTSPWRPSSAAGDAGAFPAAGEPYQPAKLYYSVWSRARILATHAKFLELGLESPFDEDWLARPGDEDKITTSIDLTGFEDVRRLALLAHATQVDPTSQVLVRPAPRGHEDDPPLRRLHPRPQPGRDRTPRGRPFCRCAPKDEPVASARGDGVGKACGGNPTGTPRRTTWPSG